MLPDVPLREVRRQEDLPHVVCGVSTNCLFYLQSLFFFYIVFYMSSTLFLKTSPPLQLFFYQPNLLKTFTVTYLITLIKLSVMKCFAQKQILTITIPSPERSHFPNISTSIDQMTDISRLYLCINIQFIKSKLFMYINIYLTK